MPKELNPILNEPQAAFLSLPQKFRAYVAGFGCVREDTEILTASGFKPISEVSFGDAVVSWNQRNQKFQLSPTSGGFPKGKENLYRVVTTRGGFVASGHHRICVYPGRYERIGDICVGQKVFSFSQGQLETGLECSPLLSPEDALSYWERLANCLDGCEGEARQCGQPLLKAVRSGLTSVLQQGDAHRLFRNSCFFENGNRGDLSVNGLAHIRQGQFFCHEDKKDYLLQVVRPVLALAGCTEKELTERILELRQQWRQYLLNLVSRLQCCVSAQQLLCFQVNGFSFEHLDLQSLFCHARMGVRSEQEQLLYGLQTFQQDSQFQQQSCLHRRIFSVVREAQQNAYPLFPPEKYCSTPIARIISIEKLKAKDWFWDIHVAGNNNYLTRDFTLHHNSGKTWAGCASLGRHFCEWPGINAGYFAPTYPQIRDIFYPTVAECFEQWGLSVDVKQSAHEVFVYSGRTLRGVIKCRSMDKPETIIGFKIGHALVDEIDVMPVDKATVAWRKILARMRYNVKGLRNGIDVTTTPEGFKFVYQQFEKGPRENPALRKLYGIIKASTYDNEVNLPPDYIPSLLESYPAQLIDAYINGEFVNLDSGTIYCSFKREYNSTDETIRPGEPLFIGMDFNVGRMAAVVHVRRDGLPCAVDEFVNGYDTPDMIRRIKERYWRYDGVRYVPTCQIRIYPDASGDSRRSVNASQTDIALLREAGFSVSVNAANPPVKDRINAMNAMFCNAVGERRYRVNPDKCPSYVEALEQQPWAKNGEPDKTTGHDHINDAAGYFIAKEYPIIRNTITVGTYSTVA